MPVVLYEIKQRVTMIQRAAGALPENHWDNSMDLDNADFRIYKGVDNRIEFLIRNTDRKAVSLVNSTLRVVFSDRNTGEILADLTTTVVDELRGMCVLTLPVNSTDAFTEGAVRYSALVVNSAGQEFLLFTDQNQKASAFCYVMASPIQAPQVQGSQVYNYPLIKANEVTIRRIELMKDGVGLDTTGYTFHMQIRTERSPTATVLQDLNAGNGDLTVVSDAGNIYLELRIGTFPTVVERINAYYDLIATKNGEQTVWLEGTIPIEAGVTY